MTTSGRLLPLRSGPTVGWLAAEASEGEAMAETIISVLNPSTVMTDEEVQALLPVMQKQVDDDFDRRGTSTPASSSSRRARRLSRGAGGWVTSDDSDQAGALGYHDVTDEGLPLGKVFAGTDRALGLEVSVTFSHELLEILGAPRSTAACSSSATTGRGSSSRTSRATPSRPTSSGTRSTASSCGLRDTPVVHAGVPRALRLQGAMQRRAGAASGRLHQRV